MCWNNEIENNAYANLWEEVTAALKGKILWKMFTLRKEKISSIT